MTTTPNPTSEQIAGEISEARRWIELHEGNKYQREAAKRMKRLVSMLGILGAAGLLGGDPTEEQIDAVARELACLKPGEPWPTNAQLGGSLTGDRDVEYREGLRGQARDLLLVAARAARWQR